MVGVSCSLVEVVRCEIMLFEVPSGEEIWMGASIQLARVR